MSDGVFIRDRDNSKAPHHWKAPLTQVMPPENLQPWSSPQLTDSSTVSTNLFPQFGLAESLPWALFTTSYSAGQGPQASSKELFFRAWWYLFTACYHFEFVSLLFHAEFGGTCQTILRLYILKSSLSSLSSFLSPSLSLPPFLSPLSLILWDEASAQTALPTYNSQV